MTARAARTALLLAGALLLAACGGGEATAEAPVASSIRPAASSEAVAPAYDFATGPAVLVSNSFEPSKERVDSTGAYLPTNGKPTLVFVDAIW